MRKIQANVSEKENMVIINFDNYHRIEDFRKFIEVNNLNEKKVVLSPERPKNSVKKEMLIPNLSRFNRLKEELTKKGLI